MSDQTTKKPATSIRLNRAEGCSTSLAHEGVEFIGPNPWSEARAQLQMWAFTAPRDGSVDKTDFTVTYADGETYDGVFGLTFTDTDLPGHMRRFLEHLLEHPDVYGRDVDMDDVTTFLREYEIGRD